MLSITNKSVINLHNNTCFNIKYVINFAFMELLNIHTTVYNIFLSRKSKHFHINVHRQACCSTLYSASLHIYVIIDIRPPTQHYFLLTTTSAPPRNTILLTMTSDPDPLTLQNSFVNNATISRWVIRYFGHHIK